MTPVHFWLIQYIQHTPEIAFSITCHLFNPFYKETFGDKMLSIVPGPKHLNTTPPQKKKKFRPSKPINKNQYDVGYLLTP